MKLSQYQLSMANIRIPDDLHKQLQTIGAELTVEFGSEAPVLQDMVSVAVTRLIQSLKTEERQEILKALFDSREKARTRMGRHE